MDSTHHTPEDPDADNPPPQTLRNMWRFAGYDLDSGGFTTAMVHFYRGEVTRSNTWRTRLDATTNWAVITTGAAITFAYGDPDNPGLVLLLDSLLTLLFLFIEARRYRYYELWTSRVRLMETNFFTGLLSPPFRPKGDWAEAITASLYNPRFPISLPEAFGRRYRRNYAFIFFILGISWVGKLLVHPTSTASWRVFWERAAIGPIPAAVVWALFIIFHLSLVTIGIVTANLRESTSEVFLRPSRTRHWDRMRRFFWDVLEVDLGAGRRAAKQAAHTQGQQVAYIISDRADEIGKALLEELQRGVTRLTGEGLYTGAPHGILMVAVEPHQADQLKHIVHEHDERAFFILTNAEVRGGGFRPLEA